MKIKSLSTTHTILIEWKFEINHIYHSMFFVSHSDFYYYSRLTDFFHSVFIMIKPYRSHSLILFGWSIFKKKTWQMAKLTPMFGVCDTYLSIDWTFRTHTHTHILNDYDFFFVRDCIAGRVMMSTPPTQYNL